MAQHSVSRTQALAKNKDIVKDRALTLTQTHTIETEVLRAPAQDLALLLDMLLSAPLMAEVAEDEVAEDEVAEDESPDVSESSDVDEGGADAEGDGTENLEDVTLDDARPGANEVPVRIDDVIVEVANDDGQRRLRLYSELSNQLLRLRGGNPMIRVYHQALRLRIISTLAIVRAIVAANSSLILDGSVEIVPLRRDVVRQKLGLTEVQFSNLLTKSSLRTPADVSYCLKSFFVSYSGDESTETAFIEVLLQRAEQDLTLARDHSPGAKRHALTDGQWLPYVNHVRQQNDLPAIGVAALSEARSKRLGFPSGMQRPRHYDRETTVIGMISDGQEGGFLRKWKRLLEPYLTHKNVRTRTTATAWYAELEVRLQKE